LTILVYLHTRSPLGRRGRTRETPRARVRRPPAPRGPVESSRAALAGFGRGGQPAPAPPLPPGRGRHTSYNGRELSFNKNRFTEHRTTPWQLELRLCCSARAGYRPSAGGSAWQVEAPRRYLTEAPYGVARGGRGGRYCLL